MAIRRDLDRRIKDLSRELTDDELEEALLALTGGRRHPSALLARLATQWSASEGELLDAAAALAGRHHALEGEESERRLVPWF